MSSTTRGPQFGDLATYAIIAHHYRKNKEREAQLAQQQAAFNACRMSSAYTRPMISMCPIYNPTYARSPLFGGGGQKPAEGLSVEDLGEDIFIGAIAKGIEQAGKGLLTAGEKRYKILDSYEKMPTELETGKQQLATAKSSSNPVRYYHEAENSFLTAATKSTAYTHKAHGYRHAAIAAKLAGDSGAAKAHQTNAKKARKAAAGSNTWADGPKKDSEACYDATKFFVNQVAQPVKDMTAGIFVAACSTVWLSLFAIQKFFKPSLQRLITTPGSL